MKKLVISKACKCGILIEQVENQDSPIKKNSSHFFLVFPNKRKEIIKFCFFCGGYELGPATEQPYKCRCKILEEWSKDIVSPIRFNEKFAEYYLEEKNGSMSVFYFCPSCGGKLADSKRNDFFLTPSESEVNKIYGKVKIAETVDEVIKILGVPDEKVITDSEEIKKQKLLGRKFVKQTLIYNFVAESFSLLIVEDEDGKIHFLPAGKPKEADGHGG